MIGIQHLRILQDRWLDSLFRRRAPRVPVCAPAPWVQRTRLKAITGLPANTLRQALRPSVLSSTFQSIEEIRETATRMPHSYLKRTATLPSSSLVLVL